AAFGKGNNTRLVKKICTLCDCNVGGGIRDIATAYALLESGAKKIILGTAATVDFLKKLPREKLIVALDSRRGKVLEKGWTASTSQSPFERVKALEPFCSSFLYTYVDKEGMMQGIDVETVKQLKKTTTRKIIYAGGISTLSEIQQLEKMGVDSVLGMAIYAGKIDVYEAFVAILDFSKFGKFSKSGKNTGLIPTIVQDGRGQVLMLAYSSEASLDKALRTRKGVYYSRSRKKLWTKGETSGNTQELLKVAADCDSDTLLFTVRQKNSACHTGSYSCFGCFEDSRFSLWTLYDIVKQRLINPPEDSYTARLFADESLLREKILEEAQEVVGHTGRDNLVWEIADLLYFLTVLMAQKDITLKNIEQELSFRTMKKLKDKHTNSS
ncbi:phosphoribosyl-ATP diphosphatase, partial [Candidatus Woesearchaeota archaeon CG_4_10_14_0_8_um_filter_47_5]